MKLVLSFFYIYTTAVRQILSTTHTVWNDWKVQNVRLLF